jgi:hypothetical protein
LRANGTDIAVRTKNKKTRKILILVGIVLIVALVILFVIPPLIPDFIFVILSVLLIIDLLLLVFRSMKYYHWSIVFIAIIIIGIIFRIQHWPLTGMLFYLGFGGLSFVSLGFTIVFLKRYKHNPFLRYFGFSSSIVLAIVSFGLLFKNMHLPAAGFVLYTGVIMFVALLFAFIFTMPASNFVNWNKDERLIFFRTIIIPMIFLFLISAMMVVFPDVWTTIMRQPITPFWMQEFDLLDKPGLF